MNIRLFKPNLAAPVAEALEYYLGMSAALPQGACE